MSGWQRGILVCLCLCISLCACAPGGQNNTDPPLEVIFLDVGQGDSVLLRTKSGDILIDAGPEESEGELCRKLRAYGVKSLLLMVFSHFDEDHIGGADGVLQSFGAKEIWCPPGGAQNQAYRFLLSEAEACGAEVKEVMAGELRHIDAIKLFVFSPGHDASNDSNESGIVLKVTCGKTSALFMGDAGVETEEKLLEKYGTVHFASSLYKVGHHGSSTASSRAFVEAVSPDWAVICCGAANSFGHPHGEVVARLEKVGAAVLRTDRLHDVTFFCNGEEFILQNKD